MLQDNSRQVWHFVVQYLQSLETHKKHKQLAREALLLLVCLGFAQLGEAYLASSLSKDSKVMLKDLSLFGLLYTRKIGKHNIFYPTRVAMELVGSQESESGAAAASSNTNEILLAVGKQDDHGYAQTEPYPRSPSSPCYQNLTQKQYDATFICFTVPFCSFMDAKQPASFWIQPTARCRRPHRPLACSYVFRC